MADDVGVVDDRVHRAEAMVGATEESAARRTLNIDNFEASPWIGLPYRHEFLLHYRHELLEQHVQAVASE